MFCLCFYVNLNVWVYEYLPIVLYMSLSFCVTLLCVSVLLWSFFLFLMSICLYVCICNFVSLLLYVSEFQCLYL